MSATPSTSNISISPRVNLEKLPLSSSKSLASGGKPCMSVVVVAISGWTWGTGSWLIASLTSEDCFLSNINDKKISNQSPPVGSPFFSASCLSFKDSSNTPMNFWSDRIWFPMIIPAKDCLADLKNSAFSLSSEIGGCMIFSIKPRIFWVLILDGSFWWDTQFIKIW